MKIKPKEAKKFRGKFIQCSTSFVDEEWNQEIAKQSKIEELEFYQIPYYTETRIVWFEKKKMKILSKGKIREIVAKNVKKHGVSNENILLVTDVVDDILEEVEEDNICKKRRIE